MHDFDYIIVGAGIAGISLCEQLRKRNKSFLVFDQGQPTATAVAGGVVNPLVVKRLNPVWKADEFLNYALPFYQELSRATQIDFIRDLDLGRPFSNVSEQNNWVAAWDRPDLKHFLDAKIVSNDNSGLYAPYGIGMVNGCFRLDTPALLSGYRNWLSTQDMLRIEQFDHKELNLSNGSWYYNGISTANIIFAEGASGLSNPFFGTHALIPKKGEYLIIKAPGLDLQMMLKGRFFIIPLGDDHYQVGATFAHGDLSFDKTEQGRAQMIEFLKEFLMVDFQIVDQLAGMRPTVKDRRPLIGKHPTKEGLSFFNGMGTRGLLMAPLLSAWLIRHLEDDTILPQEIQIGRY